MKVVYEYSHLGGAEILKVRYPEWDAEIRQVIAGVQARRGKTDGSLYSPADLQSQFQQRFNARGYGELRDVYTIAIPNPNIAIARAYKRIGFVRSKLFVAVQLGRHASMFYDFVKLQQFFHEDKCVVGVEIVPCHALHQRMPRGVSYGKRLIDDMEKLKPRFPAAPLKVVLIDTEG
jgi:hypothetical protein